MIRPLRKRHVQIWTAWAVLLPVGIISAWLAIPVRSPQTLLQPVSNPPLPVVFRQVAKNGYIVTLRHDTATTHWQLEWMNNEILTYPTATIHQVLKSSADIQSAPLIGRIEARGNYYFPLDSTFGAASINTYRFILYDFIHQQIIDTINF